MSSRWTVLLAMVAAGCGSSGPPFGGPSSGVELGAALPLAEGRAIDAKAGRSLYVPIYSHVYHSDSAASYNLSATLSVRNTDRTGPIIIRTVDYYDVRGERLRAYLERPIELPPMAAAEFFLRESDTTGGSGASFIVEWVAEREDTTSPVVQAIMIGTTGAQGISFVTEGVEVGGTGNVDEGLGMPEGR